MERDDVQTVVRLLLRVAGQLTQATRTPADDLMVMVLRHNEARLVEVMHGLLATGGTVTDQQITEALQQAGIRLK